MSAELGVFAASAPVPLLTVQVRVVENEGESSNNTRLPRRAVRTKVICKSALAQIISSVLGHPKNRRVVVGGCLFLETALVARLRPWKPWALYRSAKDSPGSSERRAFFPLCVWCVLFVVDFCDVTVKPTHANTK